MLVMSNITIDDIRSLRLSGKIIEARELLQKHYETIKSEKEEIRKKFRAEDSKKYYSKKSNKGT